MPDAKPGQPTGMSVSRPPQGADPLALAGQRLHWLEQRQRVLAQNIAQADTPGYQPRDVTPFERSLARATGAEAGMARTDPRHMVSAAGGSAVRTERVAGERAPNGNAVSLDRQALKVAETDQAHALALGLHRSWVGLYRAALGRV